MSSGVENMSMSEQVCSLVQLCNNFKWCLCFSSWYFTPPRAFWANRHRRKYALRARPAMIDVPGTPAPHSKGRKVGFGHRSRRGGSNQRQWQARRMTEPMLQTVPLVAGESHADHGEFWFTTVSLWIATSFVIGSCLFTIGGVASMIDPLVLKVRDCPPRYVRSARAHGRRGGLRGWAPIVEGDGRQHRCTVPHNDDRASPASARTSRQAGGRRLSLREPERASPASYAHARLEAKKRSNVSKPFRFQAVGC